MRVGGFQNGVGGIRGRHKDDGSIGAGSFDGLCHSIEYRALQVLGTAFARGDTAHHVRSIFNHLLRMKGAFAAGEALDKHSGFFIYKNAHKLM